MKRLIYLFVLLAVSFSIFSCSVIGDLFSEEKTEDNPNQYVNDWILDNMDSYYYWTDKIPAKTNKKLPPAAYFETLLYKYNTLSAPDGDRFSWIQEDYQELLASLNGVSSVEIGFDYVLFYKDEGENNLLGQVTYVKKGTPAEAAGVKRGKLFDLVDGKALTLANYQTLLSPAAGSMTITFYNETYVNGVFQGLSPSPALTFNTVANYAEDPVYLDSVYLDQPSGRKIGYLVYNFFASDNGDGTGSYDLKLNRAFEKFKNQGITDLVLDLRYNSGGLSTCAELLASEIVPNLNKDSLFAYYEYNDFLNDYFKKTYGANSNKAYFTDAVKIYPNNADTYTEAGPVNNVGNQLNNRLVVLTGRYTASASEQVINGLKAYMDEVILIGDTTYGKNVASFSIYEDNDANNKWGMQPIVAKYFNKKGASDFTAGFAPNYLTADVGDIGIKPLGDVRENLLNQAFSALGIFNSFSTAKTRSSMVQRYRVLRPSAQPLRGLQLKKIAATF